MFEVAGIKFKPPASNIKPTTSNNKEKRPVSDEKNHQAQALSSFIY